MKVYAFTDTNVFLEYQDYSQLDWPKILNATEVCLVVAPMVRKEIEGHRTDPKSPRRQKRARAVSGKLRELAFSVNDGEEALVPGRPGVTYLEIARSPLMGNYPELSTSDQDDHIIAAILDFQKQHPSLDTMVVSGDTGMCFKARHYGLEQTFLSEDYLLPDEPTLEQRQVRDLERRVGLLESPSPTLDVTLEGAEDGVIALPAPTPVDDYIKVQRKRVLSILEDLAGYEHRSKQFIQSGSSTRGLYRVSKLEQPIFNPNFVARVRSGVMELGLGGKHFDERLLQPVNVGYDETFYHLSALGGGQRQLTGFDLPWYRAVENLDSTLAKIQREVHNERRNRQYKPLALSITNVSGVSADDLDVRVNTPQHAMSLTSQLDTWYWSQFTYQGYDIPPQWRQGYQQLTDKLETNFKTIKPGDVVSETVGYVRVPEPGETLEVEVEILGRNLAAPVRLTFTVQTS